jgi:hypothetical protein
MAEQGYNTMPSRQNGAGAGFNTKVAAPSGPPTIGRSVRQPLVGKETVNGGKSMGIDSPGDKGLGQGVKTVKSNPIQGAANVQKGNTAMGSGSVINGFV